MANSQLTAYVSGQLDKGVSREAITQALLGAGWVQADVEAALTEVMATRPTQAATNPVVAAMETTAPSTVGVNTVGMASQASVQPVVSTNPVAVSQPITVQEPQTVNNAANAVTPASFFATSPATGDTTATVTTTEPKKSLTWLFILVGILLALGIIGGAAYAFLGNTSAADIIAPAANVQQDLMAAQQERDQLKADMTKITEQIALLENEIALFVPSTAPSVDFTIRGTISTTTTNTWVLTTARGIVLTIANAKEAAVAAALAPLRGADAEISGNHAPASTQVKVTAINGIAITPPVITTTTSVTATPTP